MRRPDTTLDTRFSDPDAVATEWEESQRVLERADLFWISTVRADGRPHVTPLVAVWLDDAIYFATGPREQKAVNLRTNRYVTLTTGCNQWEGGLDVVVEGEALQVTDEDLLAPRCGVGDEMGRTLALRRARPGFSARRRYWCRPGLLGHAYQGSRVRQGNVRSDTAPVLSLCARSRRNERGAGLGDHDLAEVVDAGGDRAGPIRSWARLAASTSPRFGHFRGRRAKRGGLSARLAPSGGGGEPCAIRAEAPGLSEVTEVIARPDGTSRTGSYGTNRFSWAP